MNQPPSTMTIELEDKDVRDDLAEMVNSMSRIRAESIKDRKLSNAQKDEYLHMSYRLASGIQAIADEPMIKRMQVVADRLNKNSILLGYDPMQDAYWRKKERRFTEALDDLLIATVRDDFHSVDAKHHVLQAVKYLGAEDASLKEREKVYDTILPFQGPVPLEKRENLLKKILGRLIGNQYKISDLEGLALDIDATKHGFSDEFVQMASDIGYTTLRIKMNDRDFEKIRGQLNDMNMQVINSEEIKPNQRLANASNSVIKYTRFIVYPLFGALPRSLQERLSKSCSNYYLENAINASCDTEFFVGLGGSLSGIIAAISVGDWKFALAIPIGISFIIDAVIRSGGIDNSNLYKGSAFLKPIFYPLEKYLDNKPKKTITFELSARKIEASKYVPNSVSFYDAIGRMEVPEDVERNLVWDSENHHQFGKLFIDYVREHNGAQPQGIEIATMIDKPNQAVVYNHELPVDGYRKYSSLFCFNGARYLLTAVEPNRGANNFVENASGILASNQDNQKKIEKLGKGLDARYIHLREYRAGQVINDMEGVR